MRRTSCSDVNQMGNESFFFFLIYLFGCGSQLWPLGSSLCCSGFILVAVFGLSSLQHVGS